MAINASVPGTSKVSPFDFGDLIRVRYKTDGRKIEGDFKAYRKTVPDQDWELIWTEKDFYYEWFCWVETTYHGGEWKVEFIDRIAGVTEEVIFRAGAFGEDICYKNVIIRQFGYYVVTSKDGTCYSRNTIDEIKKIVDDFYIIFNRECGMDFCTGTGEQVTLEVCPSGDDKRWKTCVPLRIENKEILEVYRRFCIYKSGSSQCIVYNNPDGTPNAACGSRMEHNYIDKRISEGCTAPEEGLWIEYEQECVTCTEGQIRNETYCPYGVTAKSWEECVSGTWVTKTQTCPVTCTEGAKRNVVLCPDGEFMRSWEECVSGAWVVKTGVCGCAAGTTSCQGYNLYTCVDGEWVLKERNSEECGYTENGKVGILDPIISWIETSFDVDRKTAEMYAYIGIAGIGAVFILGVMSK